MTLSMKRKLVDQDHTYCKKRLVLQPAQPKRTTDHDVKHEAEQDIDSSEDESEAEIEKAGTDYDSALMRTGCLKTKRLIPMTKILFFNYEKSEATWLQEEELLWKESKLIVCARHLKHLLQYVRNQIWVFEAAWEPYLLHNLVQR